MCLCYLFSAKTAWQLVNRKADFFTKRIDSHNESIRIANWNALPGSLGQRAIKWVCVCVYPIYPFNNVDPLHRDTISAIHQYHKFLFARQRHNSYLLQETCRAADVQRSIN